MRNVVTLPCDAPLEEINDCISRDGAVILRDVLSAEQLQQIDSELGPFWDATPNGSDDFSGQLTTRTGALLARSATCREMAVNPRVLGVCDHVLLENCERYQIHLTQAIRIRPGETKQFIHKDKWAWNSVLNDIEPQVNCMWALTDFTEENGATQVVPGSSVWPNNQRPEPEQVVQAQMSRGSVMIFTGSVLHGGGANRSNSDRIGVLIDDTLGWLRQEENQYLSCPPEIAESFDPELRRLLGYAMATYTIGYYSPPLPAGSGIEAVTPEYAVDQTVSTQVFGGAELAGAMGDDIRTDAKQ